MTDHTQPTSDWEHSHAVTEGDEYGSKKGKMTLEITRVKENGDVVVL